MTEREELDRAAARLAERLSNATMPPSAVPGTEDPPAVPREEADIATAATDVRAAADASDTSALQTSELRAADDLAPQTVSPDVALREATQGPGGDARADTVVHDAAVFSVTGSRVAVSDALVVAATAGELQADDSLIVVATAGSIGGNARVLMDTRSAAVFGLVCGIVLALVSRLLGGRRA